MRTPGIVDLMAMWSRRDYSTNSLSRAAIHLVADGEPATADALAAATGTSLDEVRAYIEDARARGAEVENGAIVGLALTLRPTAHQFRVRDNGLYTWCGFDALFVPIMLGEAAQVLSTCPVTGTPIRLSVDADGTVLSATPDTVVVGIVGEEVTSCCPVPGPESAICTQMPFFASRQAGERWLAGRSGVAIVDLEDAQNVARAHALDS